MSKKGNLISNWKRAYQDFEVTYSEKVETPIDLSEKCSRELLLEDIKKYLPNNKKPEVLECGCGGARNSLYLAIRGYNVTCSDFSSEAIRLAKANFSGFNASGTFLLDDLMNSKIPDNSFDCVMSWGLLHHFESLRPLVDNITRMLKPGGIHIHLVIPKKFSTQNISQAIWFPYKFLHYAIKKRDFHNIIKKSWRDFPHFESRFGPEDYKKAFRDTGNEIICCQARSVLLPLVYLPLRIGNAMVRYLSRTLMRLFRITNRMESKLSYFLAPAFCIICRKKGM